MKVLGIIPARENSKGIKHKNRQLLAGKPIVLHAIERAIESEVLDKIVVDSDDEIILEMASARGMVDIPFKRPAHLALDDTLISDVLFHLLTWLKEYQLYIPDAFMLLEPTCPLRNIYDIRDALSLFKKSNANSLISVSTPMQHPSNMIMYQDTAWQYCLPRKKNSRGRQDFNKAWFINGGIYLTKTEYFLKTHHVYELTSCVLYEMPVERAFDINSLFDLELVRASVNQSELLVDEKKEIYA